MHIKRSFTYRTLDHHRREREREEEGEMEKIENSGGQGQHQIKLIKSFERGKPEEAVKKRAAARH